MSLARLTLVALAGVALGGCSDTIVAPAAPPPVAAAVAPSAQTAVTVLQDAALRATAGLADGAVAAQFRARLSALAQASARGDRKGTLRGLALARAELAAYALSAPESDAADRDVIALSLDSAEAIATAK